MYIQKTDYAGRITMSLLDILIAVEPDGISLPGEIIHLPHQESTILAAVSKEAEDTIASMAGVLYDILPEFDKTGTDRNGYVLSLAKSIGLYMIYQRADDEQIPEKVIKNYDDAMDDLERISTGKKVLNLPPKPTDEVSGGDEGATTQGTGLWRIGSQKKRTHLI